MNVVGWFVAIALLSHLLFFRLAGPIGLLDSPNERKSHIGQIPVVGGLAIVFSSLSALFLFDIDLPISSNILLLAGILFFFGVIDDRQGLSPKFRFIAQIIIAVTSVFFGDLHLYFFGDIFGLGDFYLGFWGEILTVLAVVTAINAFNMIDGIDGLLAGLLLMLFTTLWFIDGQYGQFYLLLVVNVAVFTCFNLGVFSGKGKTRKMFMGDSGSMLFGYLAVAVLMSKSQHPGIEIRPVTVLWLIAVPLMDVVAIVIRRSLKGQPLMKADREHLHHIFMRMGFSDRRALVFILFIAGCFGAFGLLSEHWQISESYAFLLFLVIFAAYLYFILHAWRFVRLFNWLRAKRHNGVKSKKSKNKENTRNVR